MTVKGPHPEFARRLQRARVAFTFDRDDHVLSYRDLGKLVSERTGKDYHEGSIRA